VSRARPPGARSTPRSSVPRWPPSCTAPLLISGDDVAIAGVALTERLLSGHDSPLYGADPNLLRQELHRINFALQSTAAETDACAHDAIACT
jgi:hypothetical protein